MTTVVTFSMTVTDP